MYKESCFTKPLWLWCNYPWIGDLCAFQTHCFLQTGSDVRTARTYEDSKGLLVFVMIFAG